MTTTGTKRKQPAKTVEPKLDQRVFKGGDFDFYPECSNCGKEFAAGDKIYACSGNANDGGDWCPNEYEFCHECAMDLPQHFQCVDCECDTKGGFDHTLGKVALGPHSSCNSCGRECTCYGGCKKLSATVKCGRCAGESAKKRAKLDDKKSAVQAVWATAPLPTITKDSNAIRYAADICNRIYELGAPVPHEQLCAALQGAAASYIAFLPKAGNTDSTGSTSKSSSSSSSAVAKK